MVSPPTRASVHDSADHLGLPADDRSWSCHSHATSKGQSRSPADSHGQSRWPTSWSSLPRPARTHPAMPDKDEVPGSSLAALPTVTTAHSVAVERCSCWGRCSIVDPRRALLVFASFSPAAPDRPWTAVPCPGGWAGSSRRHVLEAPAAVQPPCGSVPTRPGSVGVTVVEALDAAADPPAVRDRIAAPGQRPDAGACLPVRPDRAPQLGVPPAPTPRRQLASPL